MPMALAFQQLSNARRGNVLVNGSGAAPIFGVEPPDHA